MKFRMLLLATIITSWLLSALADSPAAIATPSLAPVNQPNPTSQLLVKFKSGSAQAKPEAGQAAQMARLSQSAGVRLDYVRAMSGDVHVVRLAAAVPWAEAEHTASLLEALPEVEYAEPDQVFTLDDAELNQNAQSFFAPQSSAATPNDAMYSQQWHYGYTAGSAEGMNLEPAWNISTGSASTVVAVLDTGGLNHADMAGRIIAGYDMISNAAQGNDGDGRDNNSSDPGDWTNANDCGPGTSPRSSSWHGTHVAGTIGAATNNSIGVAGINWSAKIQHVRVLGRCGGSLSDIIDGIRWAAGLTVNGVPNNATPAKVLNLSLGGPSSCSVTLQSAINDAFTAGATIVVAAGNESDDAANHTPANCDNVITVASTGRTGNRAYYSNYGSAVEIAAPGGDKSTSASNGVLSTLNSGTEGPVADSYAFYQGTSMAAPHVAGLASLILALRPNYNQSQVLSLLQSTARAFPSGSSCNTTICGSGIINAGAALDVISAPIIYDEKIYLPQVVRSNVTNSSSIVNGNFESTTGWTEISSNGYALVGPAPNGLSARSGTRVASFGGLDNEISIIKQTINVAAGTATLTFWYQLSSNDSCGYDFATVKINNTPVWNKDLCIPNNTTTWQQATINMSSFAGQSVVLEFAVQTDFELSSAFFVDDVSMP